MICLPFNRLLRDQDKHSRGDSVMVRRRTDAVVMQHQLNAADRLLDLNMMTPIRHGQQCRDCQRQRRGGQEINQHQTAPGPPKHSRQVVQYGLALEFHYNCTVIRRRRTAR